VNIVGSRTLRTELEQKAAAHPDKTFVVFEDAAGGVRRYTYAQFGAQRISSARSASGMGISSTCTCRTVRSSSSGGSPVRSSAL
jgi:hypothetical protein